MIAIYPISSNISNPKYLGISLSNLIIKKGKESLLYDLNSISSMTVSRKKKLMPLITGGIIASLTLLGMFLFGVSMNLIVLLAGGMLLFYFGTYEYVVAHIITSQTEKKVWLPHSHQITAVRPFVGLIEYFAKHKHFPVVYTKVAIPDLPQMLSEEDDEKLPENKQLSFTFFAAAEENHAALGVDLTRLTKPIVMEGDGKVIGTSNYKINKSAIIDIQEPS